MNVAGGTLHAGCRPATPPTSRGDGFRLLYHGTLAQRYAVDRDALKALAQVRRDLPDVYLTIHGRGDTLEDLRALAKTLEARQRGDVQHGVCADRGSAAPDRLG